MWFESVTAKAFGPFSGETLHFTPGMNVVYGPNEAGKSSWHAALYRGLCGMRRGRGRIPAEDQAFAERHRPWDGNAWEVGAVVVLADGRRVELRHDLDGRVACSAVDADLGRDYSAEIIHDGAPDGSRWLGLDRRSFLATACVRQADLLGVLREPQLLQDYLQRAAATAGADATAAQALQILAQFFDNHVGTSRAPTKPLRLALARIETARQGLDRARSEHDEYLRLVARAEELDQDAAARARDYRLVVAKRARSDAVERSKRMERARELARRFPDGPPPALVADDELARSVASALHVWEDRPEVPVLSGWSVAELDAAIAALPEMPNGDLEPHGGVIATRRTYDAAKQALELHRQAQPRASSPPQTAGASEQELRDLARDLALPRPEVTPELQERREKAREQVESLSSTQRSWGPVVAGVALAAVGGGMALLGALVSGLIVLLSGCALLVWGLTRRGDAARLRALEALREAESALGAQLHTLSEFERRHGAASRRAAELGLPLDPAALFRLADALTEFRQEEGLLTRWRERHQELIKEYETAEAALAEALRGRGVEVLGEVQNALTGYEQACRERARDAGEARRRPLLEEQRSARRQAEQAAAEAAGRRQQAEEQLRRVASQCGVVDEGDNALAAGLQEWLQQRAERLAGVEEAQKAWAELEALLAGRTLAEVEADALAQSEAAVRVTEGLDAAMLESTVLESDVQGQLDRLLQLANQAAEERDRTRGQIQERSAAIASVPEAEEALAAAEAELARVRQLEQTLDLTRKFLEQAQERAHRSIAPVLATSVRQWLPSVTAHRYGDVRIDPEALTVQVCDGEGRWRRAELLSHGTAEQVYLLLRVAMAEHLTAPGEVCPLILDDITVQSDTERTEAILHVVHTLSRDRQVIIFTQEDEVKHWAESTLQAPHSQLMLLERQLTAP